MSNRLKAITINEQLRQMIREAPESVREISRETKIDVGTLSKFLNYERQLSGAAINMLCRFFSVTLTASKSKRWQNGKPG